MAKFRLDKFRPLVFLAVFLGVFWLSPVVIKSFTKTGFEEFHAPAWVASSYIDDLESFWERRSHSKIELITAGKELARRLAYYQTLDERTRALEEEIGRLEAILDMPGRRAFRHEVCRVIRRDLGAWWQQIVIRKGADFDIPNGAAVVFSGGVVGRVVEVNAFTSRVELVTSPNFRMAATFAGDDRPVVYQGVAQHGFGRPNGEVLDAPQDLLTNSADPLQLVSTRLGGTFPAGIAIGVVPWLEPGSSGIFQSGEVLLDERLLSLQEVSVLVPFNPLDPESDAL